MSFPLRDPAIDLLLEDRQRQRAGYQHLGVEFAKLAPDTAGDEIQNIVFEVGKRHDFESLRHWFQALYEMLLGSSQGARMGSFIALYGVENSRKLIAGALGCAET